MARVAIVDRLDGREGRPKLTLNELRLHFPLTLEGSGLALVQDGDTLMAAEKLRLSAQLLPLLAGKAYVSEARLQKALYVMGTPDSLMYMRIKADSIGLSPAVVNLTDMAIELPEGGLAGAKISMVMRPDTGAPTPPAPPTKMSIKTGRLHLDDFTFAMRMMPTIDTLTAHIVSSDIDKGLIDRRVEQMKAEGTRFRTNTEVGKDISWDALRASYDAVVVAIGSTVPRDMNIPGRQLDGIHFAMEFLPDATRRFYGKQPVHDITAEGKHVVIIGGGDTGSDCLGTSIRQGAKDVTVLQIMPQEPTSRPDNQPWPTFARLYQKTSSMEEGGEYIYNTDSVSFEGTAEQEARISVEHGTQAEGFVADAQGHVTGLKVVSVAPGDDGPFTRQPGTERVLPADLVLISVGFLHPDTTTLVDQLPVELDNRGNVARDDAYATSQDGVFACGDAGRGQSLVVWAIAEGRSCAAAVDQYLMGSTELPSPIVASERPMALPRR